MEGLVKKEEKKIFKPIEAFIKQRLNDGFENRKKQQVIKVDGLMMARLECDPEESEFKMDIYINRVDVVAQVWVDIGDDARSNNQLTLSISKQIKLTYDFDDKANKIANEEELTLFDRTPY